MRITIFTFLFVLIISLASANDSCENSKRDVLNKRNYKKCPCAVADTSFDNVSGFSGFMALTQNECGNVKVIGQFFQGFDPNQTYKFKIIDDCGNQIQDLGNLGIKFNNHGGTEPISQTFSTFNLNCDSSGIKFTKSAVYRKRNCHPASYHKRQTPGSGGAYVQVSSSGGTTGASSINYP